MTGLLFSVALLSLAAAISPVVLMVGLALMGGERPVRRSGFFALGVVLTTIVLFGLGAIAIRLQRDGMTPGPLGSPTAHLLVGIGLIAAGITLAGVRPRGDRTQTFIDRYLLGERPWHDFAVAGVAVMITNVSSFVVVIAIIHVIARDAAGQPFAAGVAFLLAALITSLPGTLPFAAAAIGGSRAERRLHVAAHLATRYGRYVMAALWIGFGLKDVLDVVLG